MHDDVTKLWMLLQIHKELLGHPKLVDLRKQIDAELQKMNDAANPNPTPTNDLGQTEVGGPGDDSEGGSDFRNESDSPTPPTVVDRRI